jgi:tRNA A58 N-methylase Trm61
MGEAGGGAVSGASGFHFVGMIVGIAAHSRVVSAGFGSYGAAMSIYTHFLARGRDVVYPKDMAMVIGLGTREGGKGASGFSVFGFRFSVFGFGF